MIRPRRLSAQLIIWFSAIALVPLSIVTISTYLASKSALHDQVTTGLFAIARRQSNQLAAYVWERQQNVATLSRMPGAIDAMDDLRRAVTGRLASGPALDILDRQYRPFLSYYQEAFGYDDLVLVLPDGRVAFSAQRRIPVGANLREDPHRTTGLGVAFDRIRTLLEIVISDFAPSGEGDVSAVGQSMVGQVRVLLDSHPPQDGGMAPHDRVGVEGDQFPVGVGIAEPARPEACGEEQGQNPEKDCGFPGHGKRITRSMPYW